MLFLNFFISQVLLCVWLLIPSRAGLWSYDFSAWCTGKGSMCHKTAPRTSRCPGAIAGGFVPVHTLWQTEQDEEDWEEAPSIPPVSEMMQNLSFSLWLISLSTMSSGSTHIGKNGRISLFFMTEEYSIHCPISFKVAKKLNLQCSHHNKEMIIMGHDGDVS